VQNESNCTTDTGAGVVATDTGTLIRSVPALPAQCLGAAAAVFVPLYCIERASQQHAMSSPVSGCDANMCHGVDVADASPAQSMAVCSGQRLSLSTIGMPVKQASRFAMCDASMQTEHLSTAEIPFLSMRDEILHAQLIGQGADVQQTHMARNAAYTLSVPCGVAVTLHATSVDAADAPVRIGAHAKSGVTHTYNGVDDESAHIQALAANSGATLQSNGSHCCQCCMRMAGQSNRQQAKAAAISTLQSSASPFREVGIASKSAVMSA
jgi:hypothetical protein